MGKTYIYYMVMWYTAQVLYIFPQFLHLILFDSHLLIWACPDFKGGFQVSIEAKTWKKFAHLLGRIEDSIL